ncbi:N-acetylglucosamine-6-phosphate deacetylase [Hymenobacter nivis]|uniref:N-acetylglucosamine-6-phosphate deacetylase n=1 Tax=Hymenobacter nivis TaxID=1850093 RepID=A0A502GZA1_9BACT|nr:N-acetylglucosamine-6-phosphate deacetylase [Hymenobacter nivis]TPG66406.1 N-acetylglucosamine-6-phosphate deacetylase [Hymenobacter nivis]
MRYLLTNCTVYTGHAVLPDHAVLIDNEIITDVLPATEAPADVLRHDLGGANLCPGFVDLQLYGGGSILFSVEPTAAALADLRAHTLRHGTTSFLPTMPTNAPELMQAAIAAVRAALPTTPGLLGLHLEGPYLNPVKKGAHRAEFIQKPEPGPLAALLAASAGVLRIMTLAPEMAPPEAVAQLRAAGVVCSAGHSDATFAQGQAAFRGGFAAATHLFNAMSGLLHRAPGLVGAILDDEAVAASVVADGVHVDYAAVRIAHKIMGERLFLITDAVNESTHGAYQFRRQGDHFVDANGTLAGSALTLLSAVRNCVQHVGIALPEALRMATLYPARVLGLADHLGLVAPGYRADLCAFDHNYNAQATVLHGALHRWA